MAETNRVAEQLHEIAGLVRKAHHLGPEGQRLLAELLEELSVALKSPEAPSAEVAHLAESAAHLVQAVHREDEAGILARARDRFEKAIVAAESDAPVATGIARRLMDALANLGI